MPEPRKRSRRPIRKTVLSELPLASEELVELAAKAFDFESWRPKVGDGGSIFFSGLTLNEDSVEGWTPLRIERFGTTAGAAFIESLWQPSGVENNALLRINVYEGTSTKTAREWLLHFLALLHSFDGVLMKQLGVGDITFMITNDETVAFSLGNLVILLQNVGKSAFAVDDTARNLGHVIASPLNHVMSERGHDMRRFKFAEGEHVVNRDIPLMVEDPDPFDGLPLTYVLISDRNLIHSRDGQLLYRSFATGPQEVQVLAVNRNGALFTQTLPIHIN